MENLVLAFKKARKGKTKKDYVIEFQNNAIENLEQLQFELMSMTYKPRPLKTFILRDTKTRKISKSDFRDRIVHHALVQIIEPLFEKIFIYDSCANRIRKGNLFAIKRFELFKRKVTNNLVREAFCLKADIKHYFNEVNHEILISILERKITDNKTVILICKILETNPDGMPLGNLTSQFFANVYLHELDFFIKQKLKAKYYLRYVDDFVILHKSKEQLEKWKWGIEEFLKLKIVEEIGPRPEEIIIVGFVGKASKTNCICFNLLNMYKNIKKNKIRVGIEISKDRKNFRTYPLSFGRNLIASRGALKILITDRSGIKKGDKIKIFINPKDFNFSVFDSIFDEDAKILARELIKNNFILDQNRSTPANHKGDLSVFYKNKNYIIEITRAKSYKSSFFKIGQCFVQKMHSPDSLFFLICKKTLLSPSSLEAFKKLNTKIIETNFEEKWEIKAARAIKNFY